MGGRRRVEVPLVVEADLRRLREDDARLELRARAFLQLIEAGEYDGRPLELMPKYGDLRDCRKVYFGVTGSAATHRIVYRVVGTEASGREVLEVVEVVAVEARNEAYVYLLSANRLARLPVESKPQFDRAHQSVVAKRGASRRLRRRDGK